MHDTALMILTGLVAALVVAAIITAVLVLATR